MIEVAIIGPTASGKSDTALDIACKKGAYILSLDSLSLYKEVDIASAKPSKKELAAVLHFGIDIIYPNEPFNAAMFMDEYERAKEAALRDKKHLVIVGGSSFYLKSMIDGLSDMPSISAKSRGRALDIVKNDIAAAYEELKNIDPQFAQNVKENDSYRIGRGLEIFFEFGIPASKIFAEAPKKKIDSDLKIYEITVDKEELRAKIRQRTAKMIEVGIFEEAEYLLGRYGRDVKPMGSIGLKEALSYLDGEISKEQCAELICIHTWQLAKRQTTFNKAQIKADFKGDKDTVASSVAALF